MFRHPRFTFFTPICFEDVFSSDLRKFVRLGADAIVNISNDYWSLNEVEARRHFTNSPFRAVENRRPVVRSTASGVTCYVDTTGRLRAELPCYQEGCLVVDVRLVSDSADDSGRLSVYTRFEDWFPLSTAGRGVWKRLAGRLK